MARKVVSLRRQDLIENPTPRVAVCLVLDCSPSMSGDPNLGSAVAQFNPRPIDEMNAGVQQFFVDVQDDEIAKYAVEIAILAFSGTNECVQDFQPVTSGSAPTLGLEMTRGGTHIGSAVQAALERLDARKEEYKDAGVDYYQPWLVLMTDGKPTDASHLVVAPEVSRRVEERKLVVFAVGIGNGADLTTLNMFSPKRPALRLKGLKFREFFQWLSRSLGTMSRSTPGEKVELDLEGIKGWGTL